eukprot:4402444-Alexandrium_andersonii.AAC.1
MSASLVGSEMCIRDRFRAIRDSAVQAPMGAQAWGMSSAVWGSMGAEWTCLLYTSDAADDM